MTTKNKNVSIITVPLEVYKSFDPLTRLCADALKDYGRLKVVEEVEVK